MHKINAGHKGHKYPKGVAHNSNYGSAPYGLEGSNQNIRYGKNKLHFYFTFHSHDRGMADFEIACNG